MGNPKRKIAALHGGVMVSGAKIPEGWAARMAQHAFDNRTTRAKLVRDTLAAWLEKHPEYTSIQHAADKENRSYGQQFRQIMEDELPHLCPPIGEYRGNGAAWAQAIRDGRAKRKLVSTLSITVPSHVGAQLRKLAAGNPEMYPGPEDVATRILTKWAEVQLEKASGQVPG